MNGIISFFLLLTIICVPFLSANEEAGYVLMGSGGGALGLGILLIGMPSMFGMDSTETMSLVSYISGGVISLAGIAMAITGLVLALSDNSYSDSGSSSSGEDSYIDYSFKAIKSNSIFNHLVLDSTPDNVYIGLKFKY